LAFEGPAKQVSANRTRSPSAFGTANDVIRDIDRLGNGRPRRLLVEAVWRFLKWQPAWKAARARRINVELGAGTASFEPSVPRSRGNVQPR